MLYLLTILVIYFHVWALVGCAVVGLCALGEEDNFRCGVMLLIAFGFLVLGASV